MIKYIKCPRCELNYIDPEKQEYCDVCIAEMKGNKLRFADIDDEEFEAIETEEELDEICPVCGVNHIAPGEKMCESCKQQQNYEEEEDIDIEKDEEWKNYLEEDEGDLTVDDETLQEEIDEEFSDDTEEEADDFYESEDVDSLSDLEDDDFEDDEDDEDEEDEDDDF